VREILSGALRSQHIAQAGNCRCLSQASAAFCANVFARKDTDCTRSTVSAGLFVSQRMDSHSAGISCTTHVGGSVWYLVRNFRCTVTIDSVWQISRHRTLSYSLLAMLRHVCPLAVKPASTPWSLYPNKLREILYLLICSFLRSVLVVGLPSPEIPEGPINYSVYQEIYRYCNTANEPPNFTQESS
jgi:hypothetical protein